MLFRSNAPQHLRTLEVMADCHRGEHHHQYDGKNIPVSYTHLDVYKRQGHNGLKHIASTLGTQNYARLRFGIGNDFPRGGQIDYVLGHFTDEDWKTMGERLGTAGEIIKGFCLAGIDITMNQYNKK